MDKHLTDEQIPLLSRINIQSNTHNKGLSKAQPFRKISAPPVHFSRERKQTTTFYVKSTWETPVQQLVALETFLEEVKFELANIPIRRPKDNLSPGERRALHNLLGDNTIIVKKADKGTTTVIMSREQKIKEGQILLNHLDN